MTRLTTSFRRAGRLDHALRAVIALEGTDEDRPCKLDDLVQRSPAPGRFLATILGALGRAGIVGSTRGSRGGYWLTRRLDEITVLAVVEAVGPGDPADAADAADQPGGVATDRTSADGARGLDGGAADGIDHRSVERLWLTVDDHIRSLLGTLTMADLATPEPPADRPLVADAS